MTERPLEGWYADPQAAGPGTERWWNGHQWTAHTRVVETVAEPRTSPVQTLRPVAALPDGTPIADLGPRLGAYALDVGLVLVVGSILSVLLEIALWAVREAAPPGLTWDHVSELLDVVLIGVTWLGYQLAFRRSGATLGKRLLHLRARPLEADGPLTTSQVLRRAVVGGGGILCTMFPGAPVFGLALLTFEAWSTSKDSLGRPWHDQVADTVVIRTPRR